MSASAYRDRQAYCFIRWWDVTSAAVHDGRMLRRGLLDKLNTSSGVWADSAYRSKKNEAFIDKQGFTRHVHHRKPKGRPMPEHIRRGNNTQSKHRAPIEHVYATQKNIFGLTVRSIGIARTKTKIGLANIAYNMGRLVHVQRRSAS